MTKTRFFIYSVIGVFCVLITVFAFALSLAGAFGAFGLPGNNPVWLILTVPLGVLLASVFAVTTCAIVGKYLQIVDRE